MGESGANSPNNHVPLPDNTLSSGEVTIKNSPSDCEEKNSKNHDQTCNQSDAQTEPPPEALNIITENNKELANKHAHSLQPLSNLHPKPASTPDIQKNQKNEHQQVSIESQSVLPNSPPNTEQTCHLHQSVLTAPTMTVTFFHPGITPVVPNIPGLLIPIDSDGIRVAPPSPVVLPSQPSAAWSDEPTAEKHKHQHKHARVRDTEAFPKRIRMEPNSKSQDSQEDSL